MSVWGAEKVYVCEGGEGHKCKEWDLIRRDSWQWLTLGLWRIRQHLRHLVGRSLWRYVPNLDQLFAYKFLGIDIWYRPPRLLDLIVLSTFARDPSVCCDRHTFPTSKNLSLALCYNILHCWQVQSLLKNNGTSCKKKLTLNGARLVLNCAVWLWLVKIYYIFLIST